MTTPANASQVEDLVLLEQAGYALDLLFFWGHHPPRGSGRGVGVGCLSQWWPSAFTVDGLRYPTAEHFMMERKARLFGDMAAARAVLAAADPAAAKKHGRQVRGFDEAVWSECSFDIVVQGNAAKFDQHPPLRNYLLGTGERVLVEASPLDRVWGIGLAADDARAQAPSAWPGRNLLGFALMRVRAMLRASTSSASG
ncbi:NADAR family protein [Frankia sp. Cj5]|uniref:NADAR family protein n=1 Tax=Frankia sp. Cj5 TaxID=2880978 RepID=UPI001EF62866|nr:NADAR family protein [Frankia sp. Cj5]